MFNCLSSAIWKWIHLLHAFENNKWSPRRVRNESSHPFPPSHCGSRKSPSLFRHPRFVCMLSVLYPRHRRQWFLYLKQNIASNAKNRSSACSHRTPNPKEVRKRRRSFSIYHSNERHRHYWILFSADNNEKMLNMFFNRAAGQKNFLMIVPSKLDRFIYILEKLRCSELSPITYYRYFFELLEILNESKNTTANNEKKINSDLLIVSHEQNARNAVIAMVFGHG